MPVCRIMETVHHTIRLLLLLSFSLLTESENLTIGIILPKDNSLPHSMSRVRPAVLIAMEKAQRIYLRDTNIYLNTREQEHEYGDIMAVLAAIELHSVVNVLFGPIVGDAMEGVAGFAPHWNLPVITPGCPEIVLGQKSDYPTLTRVGANFNSSIQIFKLISEMYDWKKFALLYHKNLPPKSPGECYSVMWPLYKLLKSFYKNTDYPLIHNFDEKVAINAKEKLQDISKKARRKYRS